MRHRQMGVKNKDLLLTPWSVAMALRADGWWVRSVASWAKLSCMPESVDDRPTSAWEPIFQLSKSGSPLFWTHRDGLYRGVRGKPEPDYRWQDRANGDAETTTEPANWKTECLDHGKKRWRRVNLWSANDYFYDWFAVREGDDADQDTHNRRYAKQYSRGVNLNGAGQPDNVNSNGIHSRPGIGGHHMRNFQMVPEGVALNPWWLLGPEPLKSTAGHYSSYPSAIPTKAISAGSSARGVCAECGAPWTRIVSRTGETTSSVAGRNGYTPRADADPRASQNLAFKGYHGAVGDRVAETIGWQPTCEHEGDPVPARVIDIFLGSGTTLIAAKRLGRDGVGIEVKDEYVQLSRERLEAEAPMLDVVEVVSQPASVQVGMFDS